MPDRAAIASEYPLRPGFANLRLGSLGSWLALRRFLSKSQEPSNLPGKALARRSGAAHASSGRLGYIRTAFEPRSSIART
eukprot:3314422-Karenia_brevis.AAC.1